MELNKIFSSNMVFAANLPIRIYGEGRGMAEISFADYSETVNSTCESWMVEFPPLSCGGPYTLKVAFEDKDVILDNIYVGMVLLCAGQSNMRFKLKEANIPEDGISADEKLRMFVTNRMEDNERFSPKDGWVVAADDNIMDWSALGFFVASEIAKRDGIAVGIIGCYQGASIIESWVPAGTYQNAGIHLLDEEKHPDYKNPTYSAWNGDGQLYDFSFSEVFPFSVSEVLWYQGESNSKLKSEETYAQMLSIMIDVWRRDLKNSELPFIIVQIADYMHRDDENWHMIQEAQLLVQNMRENVTTVVSADISESDDIHPPTKHILAHRIAEVTKLDENDKHNL